MTQKIKSNIRRKAGYSLTELLVVMVILGLLIALVGPALFNRVGQARTRTAETQVESLATALSYYRLDNGRYPGQLSALVAAPSDASNWQGPYLEGASEVPNDPWGEPYQYEYVGPGQAVLRTLGRDGQEGGEGEDADIVRNLQ